MIVGSPTILNLVPGGVMKCVHVNQVNKNIEIQFKIMNGAAPYNVPEGVTCTIRGTKGDAFGYAAEAAVTAGSNVVTVTLTEQLTAVAGAENIFELVFVGAADDMKVSTENFILAVERQAMGEDTVISDSDLSYAEQVLDQLQSVGAVNEQVQQNKANMAAEISRAKAAEAAETAARQAADNTLQSNINAEASTRATRDASLQSQINQLIAPSGSAPSAAEVENARVGADGTVYPTLGDAIRTQVTDVKSHLSIVEKSNTLKIAETSANGHYATVPAFDVSKTYALKISVANAGSHTFQVGTSETAGSMVDTLGAFTLIAGGSAWIYGYVPTGAYTKVRNSVSESWVCEIFEINTTLAGDFDQLKSDFNDYTESMSPLEDLITSDWSALALTINTDGTWRTNGSFVGDLWRQYAYVEVSPGESYRLTTRLSSSLIPAIVYFNGNTFVSYEKTGAGTAEVVTDYEFTIPNGITKIAVQSAVSQGTAEMILKKYVIELNAYTKSETDDKMTALGIGRYGIRYSITDDNDPGERVFDAVGKTASIGIGETAGSSDFDNIYPWSDMVRCNIKKNANGAPIVTFDGETDFATDGSNGDVFVRIPRFGYERYIENGFEYHVVSESPNAPVHPAFVDGGKVLDAIYIGAYEASIAQQLLRSVSGVIPGNNVTASDFLTYAQANGDCYTLYALKEVSALWVLMAVEFGKRNSNQIFGYGASDYEQPTATMQRDMIIATATSTNTVRTAKWTSEHKGYMPIGSNITVCGNRNQRTILTQAKLLSCVDGADYTDWTFDGNPIDVDTDCFIGSAPLSTGFCDSAPSGALTWHTGRANWIPGSNTRNPMRYRWIENIFGNLWHFLPDVTFNDCQMYVCDSIKKYGFGKVSDGYVAKSAVFTEQTSNGSKGDGVGVNYWVSRLNDDLLAKHEVMGRDWNTALTSQKAFGAYYYMKTGLMIVCNGGGFDHLYRSNILTNRVWEPVGILWYLYGARMIYKPII